MNKEGMNEMSTDPSKGSAESNSRPRGADRRKAVVDQRTSNTGLERRRGPGRRRSDFVKSADEGEMDPEQYLFVMAIDAYKRVNQRPYPTWTEVLEVIRKLGYRKTCTMELELANCEDWTEQADAPIAKPEVATAAQWEQ